MKYDYICIDFFTRDALVSLKSVVSHSRPVSKILRKGGYVPEKFLKYVKNSGNPVNDAKQCCEFTNAWLFHCSSRWPEEWVLWSICYSTAFFGIVLVTNVKISWDSESLIPSYAMSPECISFLFLPRLLSMVMWKQSNVDLG